MIGTLPLNDWVEVLRWLAWLALATVLARPLAQRLMPGEGGWIAGKMIGWLVVGWVPWLLASFHILPFGAAAASGMLALALAALRLGLGPIDWRGFIALEAGFLTLFWLGLAVRLKNAELIGLEKFTDMAFLAGAMRADIMPPQDAWFAGHAVNYYYVGQAMVGAWANLTGVTAAHGYQLAMATLFALTALGAGLMVAQLAAPWGRRMQAVLGASAGMLAVYGGNGHSLLYQLFRHWMPTTKDDFFYPDSTRFIGFDPDSPDKAFTEFTSYAYAVGDLHAHVLATPLFLLAAVLVHSILRRGLAGMLPGSVQAAGFGWMLGLAFTVNSWDLAILGLMALVTLTVLLVRPSDLRLRTRADGLGAAAATVLAVAALTAAPFLAGFTPFAEGVATAPARTPLWQLLVIWCHVLPALLLIPILAFAKTRATPILPIAVVAVTGLMLVALPEVIYMIDIYGNDFARANTMFKLTFRAQTLLIAAAMAILAPVLARRGGWTLAGLAALVPLIGTLAYAPHVWAPPSMIHSLDGWGFLGDERALVKAADELTLARGEALVEASSDAFTDGARVSAMTGQPTVIGWTGHEWLWRGVAEAPMARMADVDLFYTTADPVARCRIVTRYGIRYIILGRVERARYPMLDEAGLRTLALEVHSSPGGAILRVSPAACPD